MPSLVSGPDADAVCCLRATPEITALSAGRTTVTPTLPGSGWHGDRRGVVGVERLRGRHRVGGDLRWHAGERVHAVDVGGDRHRRIAVGVGEGDRGIGDPDSAGRLHGHVDPSVVAMNVTGSTLTSPGSGGTRSVTDSVTPPTLW